MPSKELPPDVLRSLVAISEVRSVPVAAEQVGISGPAVRSHLSQIEKLIGAPLIDGTGDKFSLTELGLEVVSIARKILAANDELLTLSKDCVQGRHQRLT
jgi:DNA-binding transcriptional LysR family regulator